MGSLKKNAFFNFILTFSTILFPLFSMPYISKVLLISDIGLVNKGTAFSTLFSNVFSFGLAGYGARHVARVRNEKDKLNEIFTSVLFTHILVTLVGIIVYYIYTFSFVSEDITKNIFIIFSILFAVQPLSIEWLYMGLEEFKYISLRSVFVKILMLLSLFLFVKKETDFYIYGVLYVGAQGLNAFFNIFNARKFVRLTFHNFQFKRLLWNAKFFYLQPLLAVCYQNVNQLILGQNTEQLAIFVRATTLVGLIGSFIGPIMNAVKPRLENIINNDKQSYENYMSITFELVTCILWPLGFGVASLSENIMYIFGGEIFKSGYIVLMILSIGTVFTQYSVFFNNIVSIPAGMEKNTFYGNLFVAISALSLNPICIHKYGAYGAAVVLGFSEFLGMSVQIFLIKKEKLYIGFIKKEKIIYVVSAFIMFIIICFNCFYFYTIYTCFMIHISNF